MSVRASLYCFCFRLDDPVLWGMKDFPVTDAELGRWVLAAEDICFKNPVYSYCFRLGVLFFSLYVFVISSSVLYLVIKWYIVLVFLQFY